MKVSISVSISIYLFIKYIYIFLFWGKERKVGNICPYFTNFVHFGLNCDIFRCSCRSLDSRDKDFRSPKSSLDIAIKRILEAVMMHVLKSQE